MKKLDILRALQEHHMTKADLCRNTGLRSQNINSLINGNPTLDKLIQVATGIGCDITDLFFADVLEKEVEGHEENTLFDQQESNEAQPAEAQPVQTVAFCPHCGAKVRVGVVLLPE